MAEVVMATRDASWYNRPNVRDPKQYHVVIEGMVAACDKRLPLVEETAASVGYIPVTLRCQRSACRSRWERRDG